MKKWFAVMGDPIEHSKSPAMHNAWFEDMSIDATYIPLHVPSDQLESAVAGLKTLGASGWNVTIPHKTAIIPYLDELDELAQKMGAVNTVVRTKEGKLKGYNTDGIGFVRSLEEAVGVSRKDKPVLLVGAGGAARGIAFAMQQQGYHHLTIANRTVANAQAIIDEMDMGRAMSLQEAEETLADFSIIVQMTSAGLATGNFSMPFSLDRLAKGAIVADIVYNPLMTPFLQAAEEKGATIVTGLGMFVHQGAIAFEHWLGNYPNTNSMIAQLKAQLGGN
ncbi:MULTISPECIES: shikimate dehydrogenase [Lysinibacillus]|uniref:shikimate dehydrogenase n=1 Tax=Lysinibacillus TaxID=400634 RepID=UPI00087F0E2B|nr:MULTISPECIES: shikimate dehydrogenase [unclassified Lysinibacillus]MEE3805836.1 shikimate dehydrogenase [Lysinibacillus fusiformis]SCY73993.1 shikimate dehydrogenase [Lysinibacillus sp. SG9]SDB34665.1 shikimate dehydrogenase [Lysinibacillus sp. TC-37]SFS97335.1 shikimate dehydrogenase [Lysinibacillus sp. SG55]